MLTISYLCALQCMRGRATPRLPTEVTILQPSDFGWTINGQFLDTTKPLDHIQGDLLDTSLYCCQLQEGFFLLPGVPVTPTWMSLLLKKTSTAATWGTRLHAPVLSPMLSTRRCQASLTLGQAWPSNVVPGGGLPSTSSNIRSEIITVKINNFHSAAFQAWATWACWSGVPWVLDDCAIKTYSATSEIYCEEYVWFSQSSSRNNFWF